MLPLSTAQIQKNPRHTSLSKDKRGVWKVGELSRHATCLKSHPFYCPGLLVHKRLCQEHLQRHLWTEKYWINVHTKQQHLIYNNNNMRQKMNTNTRAASGECLRHPPHALRSSPASHYHYCISVATLCEHSSNIHLCIYVNLNAIASLFVNNVPDKLR